MAKRLFDIAVSLAALILLAPLFLVTAIVIRLTSPGTIIYRAPRVGRNGEPFVMHKFRSMHQETGTGGSAITSVNDSRIYPFGSYLRRLKIDELPQFYDVLTGKMSLIGPRPEHPRFVAKHYTPHQWETLTVRPGLASPGSIYNYTHGDSYLTGNDSEKDYVERLLPIKLALETVYIRRASFLYDLRIMAQTARVIVLIAVGKRQFPDPPEMKAALELLGGNNETRPIAR